MKNKTGEWITEVLGWYGVIAILLAYALLSLDFVESQSLSYQMLNLTGAIGVMIDAIADHDAQPVVLNVIWAAIAVLAIVRILV
jgi:predicted membrane metal-binding protein